VVHLAALDRVGGIEAPGRSVPRMSPGSGASARSSSFISLHRAPCPFDPKRRIRTRPFERQPGSAKAVMGARRSEIKEEGGAKPHPGDIRGGGYPSPSLPIQAAEQHRRKTWEN